MEDAYKHATKNLNGRLIAPYQREGVIWLLWREFADSGPKGGFLSDEMGLGKTIQLIATILGNPKSKTLIVVPKSIVNQWASEIKTFAPQLKVLIHDGPDRTRDPMDFAPYQVILTPYSLLTIKGKPKGTPPIFHRIRWDRIILDEGHEIRNGSSKTSQSACTLTSNIKWIVSGTPVYNSIKDFVNLCKFLGIHKSRVQGFTQEIRNTYVLRRTKEDVSEFNKRLELPPCDFQLTELDMYPEEKELYEENFKLYQKIVAKIFATTDKAHMHMMLMLECLLRCRQLMTHPQLFMNGIARKDDTDAPDPDLWGGRNRKTEVLLDMVKTHPDEKAIIFSQFVEEMEILHEMFMENSIKVFRLDSSVSASREFQIQSFKKCTKHCVFLIQIKSGGQGLNLQEATRVYITSPCWNPATELQAIARSHRTGQTEKVTVRKLIYKGYEDLPSIDESIMKLQDHKSSICAEVLNDKRIINNLPKKTSISIKDLKNIFQVS